MFPSVVNLTKENAGMLHSVAELVPLVNQLSTSITTYPHRDMEFQAAKNMYPGQEQCDTRSPHALWHLESAIALVDGVFLADEIHRLINTYAK